MTLTLPSSRVERVAFHQSNHDGARQLTALPGAVSPTTLEDRERDTGRQGAADVVVDPATEIRSPVTGRVKRAVARWRVMGATGAGWWGVARQPGG